MQTLDSSLAFYSLQHAEQALKDANRWFNHLMDESIAFQRAMLDFELKPMEVDDAVALWFPVVTATSQGVASHSRKPKRAAVTAVSGRRSSKTSAPAPLETVTPVVAKTPKARSAAKTTPTPTLVDAGPSEVLINDLKLIAGIGPGLEKKLNAAGITSYAQIAALTATEITRLERDVVKFAGRITRDDWIGQAQQLLGQ